MNDPQAPRKSWPRRHKILTGLAIAVLVIIGASIAAAGGKQPKHIATAATQQPAATPASTPPSAAPAPNPQGTANTSCDDDLGSSSIYSKVWLTGETDVKNTGNVGIEVRVRFFWHQEAYPDVTLPAKTVRVKPGHVKAVRFRYYAGTFAGSTEPLDRWQSWQDSHSGQPCHAKTAITGTFGIPQS